MRFAQHRSSPSNQSGAVLLVAIVLLLLAGVMTMFALNVGVFEQRSTANDMRGKMVNGIAEAGLASGAEFLLRQHRDWMSSTAMWELCQATDTKFPCGVIPQFEPDGTTPRRATMFRYKRTAAAVADIPADLSKHMLPLDSADTIGNVGGVFDVAYGVAPVLCFVKKRAAADPVNTPLRCTANLAEATKQRIATFVSVARIPGEAARATLTQVVGQYPLIGNLLGAPPILASGSIDLVGTLQVVTNPDSGGPGVPVSIWSRKNVSKSGTPNTCYADEFFRYGGKTPVLVEGILTCNDCGCANDKSLSFDSSGGLQQEGMDILDIDGNTAATPIAGQINHDVLPSEFPCDLFENVFGVKSWRDTDGDFFCETKITTSYSPSWNPAVTRTVGVDEAFLYKNARNIMVDTANADAVAITNGSGKVKPANWLTNNATAPEAVGLIWCQKSCDIGPNDTIGTPTKPVIFVADGDTTIKGTVFGFVFIRSTGNANLSATTGGNATLSMNGNAAVYGAVVVQGEIDKANGTAAVIYSREVLEALENSEDNIQRATLPGAWTDLKSY